MSSVTCAGCGKIGQCFVIPADGQSQNSRFLFVCGSARHLYKDDSPADKNGNCPFCGKNESTHQKADSPIVAIS